MGHHRRLPGAGVPRTRALAPTVLLAALLLATTSSTTTASAAVTWSVTPFGMAPSPTGNPVSDTGYVAGTVPDPHTFRSGPTAAVFDPATRTLVYPPLSARASWAADVNDAGLAVGGLDPLGDGAPEHPWFWRVGSPTATLLLPPAGGDYITWRANAVSDTGLMVGTATRPDLDDQVKEAAVWNLRGPKAVLTVLGTLSPEGDAEALGVNNAGVVVGKAVDARGYTKPFVYLPDTRRMVDLGVLPGFDSGIAHDVNDGSVIVGESFLMADPSRRQAWVWNPTTRRMSTLDPTGTGSAAYAVNRYGVVAGQDSSGAVVWGPCQPRPTRAPGLAARGVNRTEKVVGTVTVVSELYGPQTLGERWIRAGGC